MVKEGLNNINFNSDLQNLTEKTLIKLRLRNSFKNVLLENSHTHQRKKIHLPC